MPWTRHHAVADFAAGKVPAGVRAGVVDNNHPLRNGEIENGQLTTVEFDERTLLRAATRNRNKLNEGRFQLHCDEEPGARRVLRAGHQASWGRACVTRRAARITSHSGKVLTLTFGTNAGETSCHWVIRCKIDSILVVLKVPSTREGARLLLGVAKLFFRVPKYFSEVLCGSRLPEFVEQRRIGQQTTQPSKVQKVLLIARAAKKEEQIGEAPGRVSERDTMVRSTGRDDRPLLNVRADLRTVWDRNAARQSGRLLLFSVDDRHQQGTRVHDLPALIGQGDKFTQDRPSRGRRKRNGNGFRLQGEVDQKVGPRSCPSLEFSRRKCAKVPTSPLGHFGGSESPDAPDVSSGKVTRFREPLYGPQIKAKRRSDFGQLEDGSRHGTLILVSTRGHDYPGPFYR